MKKFKNYLEIINNENSELKKYVSVMYHDDIKKIIYMCSDKSLAVDLLKGLLDDANLEGYNKGYQEAKFDEQNKF